MAYDKVVDSTFLDEGLFRISNAIRTKSDYAMAMRFPSGFVEAISSIPTNDSDIITGTITIASETENTILGGVLPIREQVPKAFWIMENDGIDSNDTTHSKHRLLALFAARDDGGTTADLSGTYFVIYIYTIRGTNSASSQPSMIFNAFNGSDQTMDTDISSVLMSFRGDFSNGDLFFGSKGDTFGLIGGRTYSWGVMLWDQ